MQLDQLLQALDRLVLDAETALAAANDATSLEAARVQFAGARHRSAEDLAKRSW